MSKSKLHSNKMKPLSDRMKKIMLTALTGTREERDAMAEEIRVENEENEAEGRKMVLRALNDSLFTPEEFDEWMVRYAIDFIAWATILAPVFQKIDGFINEKDEVDEDNKVVLVTLKDSPMWRMKSIIKKRFGFDVMTAEQARKMMEKETGE